MLCCLRKDAQAALRELLVDNSAAITLASEEGGSWRTRLLKVRAGAVRQRGSQLADGLRKILAAKNSAGLGLGWPHRMQMKHPNHNSEHGNFEHQQSRSSRTSQQRQQW